MTPLIIASVYCALVLLVLYTYLFYPLLLRILSAGRFFKHKMFTDLAEMPRVFICMSAFNEEKVIAAKIHSVFDTSYPADKIIFLVGSDASIDGTNAIAAALEQKYPGLNLYCYDDRSGKANVLNRLVEETRTRFNAMPDEVLLFTDANVLFTRDTLTMLARHFADKQIGQVGANIINLDSQATEIAEQEKFYISRENKIKYHEGLALGSMMGAFGACYAIRHSLFLTFPSNYLMEDFYESMHVLKSGCKAILDLEAVCYEDIPGVMEEEYKRKRRISAGNYQNLSTYWPLLLQPFSAISFTFWSHKFLRWMTPYMLILIFVLNIYLLTETIWYLPLLVIQVLFYTAPLLDSLLKMLGIHIGFIRFITYFIMMNMALISGLFMYLKGIKSNVWQPTQRAQG